MCEKLLRLPTLCFSVSGGIKRRLSAGQVVEAAAESQRRGGKPLHTLTLFFNVSGVPAGRAGALTSTLCARPTLQRLQRALAGASA